MADQADATVPDVDAERPAKRKRPRCQIDLSDPLDERLEEVAGAFGETKAEVVRRAIEHWLKCREYRGKGYETGAFRELDDGSVRLVSIDPTVV